MAGEAALLSVSAGRSRERIVVVCALSPRQRARVMDATRGRVSVRSVDTFDQLRLALGTFLDVVDCVVIPPRDGTGVDAIAAVRQLIADWPRIAIIAYCQTGAPYPTDIRALASAGVHQFVFVGVDDDGIAFRAVLLAARQQCAAENVMQELGPVVPSTLHAIVEAALGRPDVITTVSSLAGSIGVTRGTVFNRCARAWSLKPEELLVWVRLALVAYFLETTGNTIESIASQLSYSSDTALRNTMKRYCGIRASEIRSAGGLRRVVDALRQRVAPGAGASEHRSRLHLE